MNGEKGSGAEMEINLVAEGWRKLGMLTQVVLNGALKDKGFLFWDEPDANLNPRLIRELAKSTKKPPTPSNKLSLKFVKSIPLFNVVLKCINALCIYFTFKGSFSIIRLKCFLHFFVVVSEIYDHCIFLTGITAV